MTQKTEKETKCLFILSENGKWGVNDHLKPLGAFYNGVGWFVEDKHRHEVEQICQQAEMKFHDWPLHDETFNDMKRSHKRAFYYEKSAKLNLRIDALKATLGISNVDLDGLLKGESRHDLEKIPDGRKLIETASELDRFQEQISRIEDEERIANITVKREGKFQIKFLNEFDQHFLIDTPPKKPMLLEYADSAGHPVGFLPKGIVTMLVGAGGVGKTHFLAQLALSIASGTNFLEIFNTTEHCGLGKRGYVFFGLGENQYDDIHRVLYKAARKLRESQPDLMREDPIGEATKRIAPFSFCGQQAAFIQDGNPSMYFQNLKTSLIDKAPSEGWSMIILDPVSRLLGVDAEVDNAAATQFIALLEELIIDLPGSPTVLFAHHVNKGALSKGARQDQTAARGSSALTDGARLQFNLAKLEKEESANKPGNIVLKTTKSNFTAIPEDIYLRNSSDGFLEYCRPLPNQESNSNFHNSIPKAIHRY